MFLVIRRSRPQYITKLTFLLFLAALITLLSSSSSRKAASVEGFKSNFVVNTSLGPLSNLLSSGSSESLCICHQSWTGIKTATYAQGRNVIEIQEFNSKTDYALLSHIIGKLQVRHIVINGIPPGTIDIPSTIKSEHPDTRVSFIYHGTPAQHAGYPVEGQWLNDIIARVVNGTVFRLGFVRRELNDTFHSMSIPRVFGVDNMLSTSLPKANRKRIQGSKLKIGALFWFNTMKNPMTQLLAACSIKGAELHVLELDEPMYLEYCAATIIVHGLLPQSELYSLIARMDVLLYVSLSESSGLMALDALSMGIPCIISHTGGYLREDSPLFQHLVVSELNSPKAIRLKILHVYENMELLYPLMEDFVTRYTREARSSVETFFEIN